MREYIVSTDTAYEFEMRRFEELQELIRCKECRWHEIEQPGMVYCPNIVGGWVEEEGYCYLAEKEEHERENS